MHSFDGDPSLVAEDSKVDRWIPGQGTMTGFNVRWKPLALDIRRSVELLTVGDEGPDWGMAGLPVDSPVSRPQATSSPDKRRRAGAVQAVVVLAGRLKISQLLAERGSCARCRQRSIHLSHDQGTPQKRPQEAVRSFENVGALRVVGVEEGSRHRVVLGVER